MTIVIAGVSFLAYVALRLFGPSRGLLVASVVGALVSSTAVTLHLGRMARDAGRRPAGRRGRVAWPAASWWSAWPRSSPLSRRNSSPP